MSVNTYYETVNNSLYPLSELLSLHLNSPYGCYAQSGPTSPLAPSKYTFNGRRFSPYKRMLTHPKGCGYLY